MLRNNYNMTMRACFIGYIIQAIVNNFAPLLFVVFQSEYGISLEKITLLITINFGTQLLVDLLAGGFVDKIGYRSSMIIAHLCSGFGLVLLTCLPRYINYYGILISVVLYAIGGGLLEVIVSPIVENCPTDNKEMAMSLLHSFYSWGQVLVILLSTIAFKVFSIEQWKIVALLWSIVPFGNMVLFFFVPINEMEKNESSGNFKNLIKNEMFWLLLIMITCAGASEQTISQWASTFAVNGLHIDKTLGDLLGPMCFGLMMAISRTIFGKYGDKLNLKRYMVYSALLCVVCYIVIGFSSSAIAALLACALCGFSVGIMWPGTFSIAGKSIKNGGTLMYSLFAFGGDIGCSLGPTVSGFMVGLLNNFQLGLFCGIVFPIVLLIMVLNRKI